MEKGNSICGKFSKWWRLHNKCVVVYVATLLLFVIIGWISDRCTNSYQYLGTASIVLSIALSLVVIGYTLAQNVITHISSSRMQSLIERIEQEIHLVKEDVNKVLIQEDTQVTSGDKGKADSAEEAKKAEVSFSLLATSNLTRLFAHFLWRSYELKKPLQVDEFIDLVEPLVKMNRSELSSYVYGILHGMMCSLKEFMKISEQNKVQMHSNPENFKEHLEQVTKKIEEVSPRMDNYIKRIKSIQ